MAFLQYFWGSTGPDFTFALSDNNSYNPQEKYRTLLRFNSIHTCALDSSACED